MNHHLRPTLLPVVGLPVAQAQALSPGCQWVNHPAYDGFYMSPVPRARPFYAGERLLIQAANPWDFNQPTRVSLTVNGVIVSETSFPGTVSYTFPQDGDYKASWTINVGANVTWTVSCGWAPPPAPAPALFLSDVCEPEDGFSADGWMTLDTNADDLGQMPVLWVSSSVEGPWAPTWYSSPPYILSRDAVNALAAQAGVADYHDLWLKGSETGQPVRLGAAIIGRQARMDRLCGIE